MKKTKMISAFLAAMLAVSSTMIPISAEEGPHQFGDVNGDNKINVSDAVLIARINAEDSTVQISDFGAVAADANQDGHVDSDDLTDMLRYLAGLIPALNSRFVQETHDYAAKNLTANVTAATELETEPAEGFRAAQLNFTANLLKESAKAKGTEKSILVSPYSVAMALGMTANGAKEQTRTEMETVLGGSLKMDDLNNSYLNILQNSPKSGTEEVVSDGYNEYRSATLDIANSIWYNEDPNLIQVPEEFLQKSVDYYGAEAFAANGFELPVIKDINYWVRNNTHGMIDKILPENENISIDPIVMILVNALAFEGDWSVPFRNDQVSAADFTLENGEKFKTDMMYDDDHIYFEDDSAVGFKKYYEGGKYSFIGVLPNEELTISQYVGNLTGEKLQKFLDSESRDYEVDYAFPKFKYDFDLSLKNPLIEMGMPSAFDGDKADFSGLNERPDQQTYISDVLHKTHIEVDQKGTRAAAVTAVIMAECTAVGPEFHKTVRLDRPFVYMIYDEERKLPVFIGTVMQPSEATAEAEPEPVFPDVNP